MNIAIGRTGIRLSAVASLRNTVTESFSSHELRAELVLDDNNSKNYFQQLEAEKEKIEKEIGEQLTWHNLPDKCMCRIYVRKSTDLQDRAKWTEQHKWLLDKLELFYKIFAERVRRLEVK